MTTYKMSTNKPLDFVGRHDKVWNVYKKAAMPCDDLLIASALTEIRALEICEILNDHDSSKRATS
jgi:hypothetical protein